MATQTGSIDLEATNAVKLAAEASVDNKLTNYATHAQLDLSANQIRGEVAETYATKDEAALELDGSGKAVVLDEAADVRLKALTIHGLSQQDGTPMPSAPVAIRSVQSPNLQPFFSKALDDVYNSSTNPNGYWRYAPFSDGGTGTDTTPVATQLSDGWVHVEWSGTASRRQLASACPVNPKDGSLKPSTTYTVMCEVRGLSQTGTKLQMICPATSGTLSVWTTNKYQTAFESDGTYWYSATTVANLDTPNQIRCFFVTLNGVSTSTTFSVSCDLRVSLYEGTYFERYVPVGAIQVTSMSKNRFDDSVLMKAGNTNTTVSDGTVTVSATSASGWSFAYASFPANEGETYTVSATVSGNSPRTLLAFNDATDTGTFLWSGHTYSTGSVSVTGTAPSGTNFVQVFLYARQTSSGAVGDSATYAHVQLEIGDTATAYEPYSSTTTPIPVTLRSLPDGTHDEWVSGESADTHIQRVGSDVFDGSSDENWHVETLGTAGSNFYIAVSDATRGTYGNRIMLTLCPACTSNYAQKDRGFISGSGNLNLTVGGTLGISTVADFRTWLATNPVTAIYPLATPITTTYPHTDLPYVSDGDSVWVDAQVTPTIDVTYWSKNGETVSALSSTLTQTAAGLELQMQGKVDSDEEWVSWMHAGTDPTTHEPYLAMGQDSDYPSVVYGSGEAQFYDGEGDVEHNILARFGSNGAIIGRSDESHITQTATTTRLFGSDGILVLEAGFQNVSDGHGSTKQGVRVTDSNNASYIAVNPTTDSSGFDGKLDFDVYCKGIGLMSSSGGEVVISSDFAANGLHAAVEARKTISGTEQIHGFTLGFDPNDNPYVNIGNPAAWLAALGLTVEQSNMTFASGLNSSYGSAPVRKYGAMGILKLNSVRLASQLASGGSVVIGTLPTGYVPVGSVDMHINIESNSSNYRNNYITVEYSGSTNPGRVTLYNRSGYAIPNTVTFSCTCPFFV